MEQKKVNAKANFGSKGWYIIILLAIVMFMGLGFQSEGMNVVIPGFQNLMGLDSNGILYSYNSLAGWIGVIGTFFWGVLASKIGGKKVLNISLLLYSIFIIIWGQVNSPGQYFAVVCGVLFCLNGAMSVGLSNMVANWFPLKKGIVMGYVTIGAAMCPIFTIPLFSGLVTAFGFRTFFLVAGIILIVVFLLTLTVKNRPEEAGAFPDNDKTMTPEQAKKLLALTEEYKKTSSFTFGRLLKTKQTWFTAVGCGILLLVPVGFMSSLVARLTSIGFDMPKIMLIMAIGGVGNLLFSIFTGVVDVHKGTKNATYMCYALYFIAMVLTIFMTNIPVMIIGTMIVIFVSGGVNNLTVSMSVSIFGRYDFAKAFAILSPISVCVRNAGYMAVGTIVAATGGSYTISNVVLIVIMIVGVLFIKFNDITNIGRSEEDFQKEVADK
jgi:MFS family permease